MSELKKLIMFLFLFCWCINIYGQESLTDTTEFSDITWTKDNVKSSGDILYPWLDPIWVDFVKLYEEYETHCFNDSTKQCFNYYTNYYLAGSALDSLAVGENYKTLCSESDFDLGINMNYAGTHEEWIHVQPKFIGFMQYLKELRPPYPWPSMRTK